MGKQPSPAERLAQAKQRTRPRRNVARKRPPPVLVCRLRERRDALGLSMDDVAAAVGLSKSGLFMIEHGADTLLTTAHRLATFFGVSVETIWPGPVEA